jgi:hypothetical protein
MLLDDIIKLATDGGTSVPTLLRNCQVLANKLKNENLKTWTSQELNGYEDRSKVPQYRILPAESEGTFVTTFGNQAFRSIPSVKLEPRHREFADSVRVGESIAALENIIASNQSEVFYPWNNNFVLYYQNKLLKNWGLIKAHQLVSLSAIIGIVDTVRNRVLEMALEIQNEVGTADTELSKAASNTTEAEKIDQKVTTIIYGKTVVFAPGSTNVHTSTSEQNIVAGDWESLKQALTNAGIEEPEVEALSIAVKQDGGQKAGSAVQSWIAKNASKVLVNGMKMGAEVGKTLLTEWLMRHYGLK